VGLHYIQRKGDVSFKLHEVKLVNFHYWITPALCGNPSYYFMNNWKRGVHLMIFHSVYNIAMGRWRREESREGFTHSTRKP